MKTSTAITIGIVLVILSLLIYTTIIEQGDINTIGLILVIFAIPAILIGFINGFFLDLASRRERIVEKRIWSFFPLLLLAILAISDFRLLDANISFLGVHGLIALGITNLVWNIKLERSSDNNTLHNNI